MANIFFSADYSAMESWLTAYDAQDEVMLRELRASLEGGPKIHALNAALFYDINPSEAKTHYVKIQGRDQPAYAGGKRISHLWNYGGGAAMISHTLWIPKDFATKCERKLAEKYKRTAERRTRLANQVFGLGRFVCPRCGAKRSTAGNCTICRHVQLRWQGWTQEPERVLYTRFRRRRLYPGLRKEGANAVAAQEPQSAGASVWLRTLHRLNGFQVHNRVRKPWPTPSFPYRIATGTYDSYLGVCAEDVVSDALTWMLWTMERPWPQLGGLRLPAEGSIGKNYGERSETNPEGLEEIPYRAFTANNPFE